MPITSKYGNPAVSESTQQTVQKANWWDQYPDAAPQGTVTAAVATAERQPNVTQQPNTAPVVTPGAVQQTQGDWWDQYETVAPAPQQPGAALGPQAPDWSQADAEHERLEFRERRIAALAGEMQHATPEEIAADRAIQKLSPDERAFFENTRNDLNSRSWVAEQARKGSYSVSYEEDDPMPIRKWRTVSLAHGPGHTWRISRFAGRYR